MESIKDFPIFVRSLGGASSIISGFQAMDN